uniref:Uncharacterized protein n=1 Tax=Anguilla anguilla TaxID=7936 RepID=A0A0E9XWB2_ANGAN
MLSYWVKLKSVASNRDVKNKFDGFNHLNISTVQVKVTKHLKVCMGLPKCRGYVKKKGAQNSKQSTIIEKNGQTLNNYKVVFIH